MNLPIVYAYSNAQVHTDFLIRIVSDKNEILAEVFGYGSVYSYNEFLKQNFPLTEEEFEGVKFKVFTLPAKWVSALAMLKPSRRSPMKCNYMAAKQYLSSLFGVNLSSEDEEFFENHPCVQQDGVPMQDTLRVMQELIDPYGFRISRVQVAPGVAVGGDLLQWRKILGVNPAALADKATTNAMWKEQVPEDATVYNFEYTAEPLRPSITCAVLADVKGIRTGLSHGHATYTAPRGKLPKDTVLLSIQLERKGDVKWNAEPKYAEVAEQQPLEPIMVFELSKCWGTYNSHIEKYNPKTGVVSLTDTYCYICKGYDKTPRTIASTNPPGVCQDCWDREMSVAFCTNKGCLGTTESGWVYQNHTGNTLEVSCEYCKKQYIVESKQFTKPVYRILDAIGKHISFHSGGPESRRSREVPPVKKDGTLPEHVPLPPAPPTMKESDFWMGD